MAALQCVERGHFTLDEDVTRLLPELKDIEVQVPSKDGEGPPTRVKAKNAITLRCVFPVAVVSRDWRVLTSLSSDHRHLLTHTSGLSYTKFGDLSLPLLDRCLAPLLFEPGEGWIYGSKSIDAISM